MKKLSLICFLSITAFSIAFSQTKINPAKLLQGATGGGSLFLKTDNSGNVSFSNNLNGGVISGAGNAVLGGDLVNKSQLDAISIQSGNWGQLDGHGMFTDFNNISRIGASFVQGTINAPSWMGAAQGYQQIVSLGAGYNWSGSDVNSYAQQTVIGRSTTTPYYSVRWKEGGFWSAWNKIWSGYSDNSGMLNNQAASFYTNASNISTGILADGRLSGNIPLKNAANTFTASQWVQSSGANIATFFSTDAAPNYAHINIGSAYTANQLAGFGFRTNGTNGFAYITPYTRTQGQDFALFSNTGNTSFGAATDNGNNKVQVTGSVYSTNGFFTTSQSVGMAGDGTSLYLKATNNTYLNTANSAYVNNSGGIVGTNIYSSLTVRGSNIDNFSSGTGYVNMNRGTTQYGGFFEIFRPSGSRAAYIGFPNGATGGIDYAVADVPAGNIAHIFSGGIMSLASNKIINVAPATNGNDVVVKNQLAYEQLAFDTEANLNNLTAPSVRNLAKTGHSSMLRTSVVGGSTGTVQEDINYYGLSRFRIKVDNTTWSTWFNVVSTTTPQYGLTGNVLTSDNFYAQTGYTYMQKTGNPDNSDVYWNARVIRNSNSSNINDGMYIGYGNTNSGLTRIYGGGATTGGIQVNGSGINDVVIAGYTALNLGNYAANLNSVYLGITATAANSGALNGQNGFYYRNASNINTGTLADAQLSANVALLSADNAFSGRMAIGGAIDAAYKLNVVGNMKVSTSFDVGTSITASLLNLTGLATSTTNTQVLSINSSVVKSQEVKDLEVATYQPVTVSPFTSDIGGGVIRHSLTLDCASYYKKTFKVYMTNNTIVDGTQVTFTNMKPGGDYTVIYYSNPNRPVTYDSSAVQESGSGAIPTFTAPGGTFIHRFASNGTVAIKAF